MDKIIKLLNKVKRRDRERLLSCIEKLKHGELETLKVKKVVGSLLHRVRVGNFRIFFSVDTQTKQVEVVSIRLRNERTYQ